MRKAQDRLVEIIEKYCTNEVILYQITTTDGKPEERSFKGGSHIATGGLAQEILKEFIWCKEINPQLNSIHEELKQINKKLRGK